MSLEKENYIKLCKYCDKTLLLPKKNNKDPFIFISWLYIINEHPNFLKKYHYLFFKNKIKSKLNILSKFIYYFFSWISHLFFSLKIKKLGLLSTKIDNKIYDIIIISHLSNIKNLSIKKDFYFGNIPTYLNSNKFRVLSVYLNKTNNVNLAMHSREFEEGEPNRIVLGLSMSFLLEFKIFLKILKNFYQLFLLYFKIKNKFHKSIILGSIVEIFSGNTRNNYRMGNQIHHIVKTFSPKYIIVTYEGHAWERIAFSQAKDFNPKIKCIGYQHSRIFNLQHSLGRSLGKKYDPDLIWTSGVLGMEYLKKTNDFQLQNIIVVGSDRFEDFKKNKLNNLKKTLKHQTCLVLPEGHISECLLLFKFSLSYALKHPQLNFIWRLHPEMSFNELKKRTNIFSNIPKNIILSRNDLKDDLKKSQFALYRGSTSVYFALIKGLKPIYYQLQNELNIDPLNILGKGFHYVKTISDMETLIKKYNKTNIENENYLKNIQNLILKIISPINKINIVKSLQK